MMKTTFIKSVTLMLWGGILFSSCNDYLDKSPKSYVTPENYLNTDDQLAAYANNLYTDMLPYHDGSYGTFGGDNQTDNQTGRGYDGKYVKGNWKVPMSGGAWGFGSINNINYFFDQVLPKYENNLITGDKGNIRHYIGEMYFFRACAYFSSYRKLGDFPIITTTLPDDLAVLTEASKRAPRNEVARFILEDLDKAAEYMQDKDMASTRVNRNVALLIKSRVALFEGSWLKNFAGTAFVPGTDEWPGKDKDYHSGFSYKSGSIESEYQWFFQQAMEAAKEVSEQMTGCLAYNTGIVPQTQTTLKDIDEANPYLAMFGTEDLSTYPEVLLWRQYSRGMGITHNTVTGAQYGNFGIGVTRGMIDGFLMSNGLPVYAEGSGYKGDRTIADVRTDRDPRLSVFLKEPGQKNILIPGNGDHAVPVEPYPNILSQTREKCYTTGYALRKGGSFDQNQCYNSSNYTACPVYRGVEALLNYIEACYELNGDLDATARKYWMAVRSRHAGMDTDFQKTIDHTDVAREARNDWGAYTAGKLVDATLYNIRRERRCEMMSEGLRWMDLCRWRALDQMVDTPYHIEGIHIWGTPMEGWYDAEELKKNISPASRSEYLRPYEADAKSEVMDGYTWSMAHYLDPIMIKQFLLTSSDGATVSTSPIYQNPYWPTEPNLPAEK